MTTVFVLGRCLGCWTASIKSVEVGKHLPPAFKSPCATCGGESTHAVTGQVVNTLSPAAMREIKGAHKRKVRVNWEQLPLVPALTPKDAPTSAPGETRAYAKPTMSTANAGPVDPRRGH
jgi:hypothetical protein